MGSRGAAVWWRTAVELAPAQADAASGLLSRFDTSGMELVEGRPHAGPGRCVLFAYFSRRPEALRAAWALSRALAGFAPFGSGSRKARPVHGAPVRVEPVAVDPAAWRRAWRQALQPVRVGGMVVGPRPPGRRGRRDPGAAGRDGVHRLAIPPGMAFGTGHHPSTQQALWALELAMAAGGRPAVVVDVGTGSGVLALAARLLGARRVVAVDVDPVAVRAARENARLNGVRGVTFRVGSVEQAAREVGWGVAAVVAANLVAETLVELAPELARLLAPGGTLIGAGIAEHRTDEVARAWQEQGLTVEAVGWWGGWAWVWACRPAGVGR